MNGKSVHGDIMGDLLSGGADQDGAPDLLDLEKIIHRDPGEASKVDHRSFRMSSGGGVGGKPFLLDPGELKGDPEPQVQSFRLAPLDIKKTTVYFSNKLHIRLKSAKYNLKKCVPSDKQSLVTMSEIVNIALRIVLAEYEAKGEAGLLGRLIKKKLGAKDQKA